MRTASVLMLAVIGCAGCEPVATEAPTPVTNSTTPATNDTTTNDPVTTTESTSPDNTAVNERDADGATKTPLDQNENQADVTTTAEIRKRIVAQDGLSINAQNAKIITADGKVTLRGPVESAGERDTLDKIAKDVAGEANVNNQLEVANP
jgi:hyperosmotically inducible periplasmic protein